MNPTLTTWGQCDRRSAQGWMYQTHSGLWTASWSGTHNTLERDGPVTFDGSAWRSAGGRNLSYPYAIIDDFGFLTPVSPGHWPNSRHLHEESRT